MDDRTLPTLEELDEMARVDIRNVDRSKLVDIATVKIDTNLSVEDRVKDYIRQIKNPYCYISHGVVVKIGFKGNRTLEECLKTCLAMEA